MNKLEQPVRNLLDYFDRDDCGFLFDSHMEALREALVEKAERVAEGNGSEVSLETEAQEPVGYFAYDEEHDIWEELTGPNAPGATPLYTALQFVKQEPVAFIGQGLFPLMPDDLQKLRKHEPGMATLYDTPLYAAPVSVEAAVLAEREACAQTVETESQDSTRYEFAAAIRARGEKC